MFVSGVQQSYLVLCIYVSVLLHIIFPFRLLQNIEQSFLCYTVDPSWLFILNIVVCVCQSQTPNLSLLLKTMEVLKHTYTQFAYLYICVHLHSVSKFFFK